MVWASAQVSPQEAQVLLALSVAPLDRVRLMKTLFLAWHRLGRPTPAPFGFSPYLYGPCSFELYGVLRDLQERGLVVITTSAFGKQARYHLTNTGRAVALQAQRAESPQVAGLITSIAGWASTQSFRSLLGHVYAEAPDFAVNSVLNQGGQIR